jgi:DNA-binding NtrC family response regulator
MELREGRGLRLLLIDENRRTRDLFRSLLEDEGHKVTVAGSYIQAARLLFREPFDLVVSEIQGSEGEQHRFARFLGRRPGVPMILHTAWPQNVRSRLDWLASSRVEKRADHRPLLQLVDRYALWPVAARGRTA